jgi:hypothetical protein
MRFSVPQLRQLRRADEGQAIVLVALGLAVVMLMAGMGVAGGGTVIMSAPTSGEYARTLFFEDRNALWNNQASSQTSRIWSGSASALTGALFRTATLEYSASTSTSYPMIVAYQLQVAGTSNFGANYSSLPGGLSPIQSAVMGE